MTASVRLHGADAAPAATAGVLAALAIALGWRGADWPAQLLRMELVERDGPEVWNNLWFAGHHTIGYGIVFPALAAVVGPTAVAIGSCVVATLAFHLIAARVIADRRRVVAAGVVFGAGTVVNVAIGRLTFAVGLAIALAAVAAVGRERYVLGGLLTVSAGLASPVAAVFLAIAMAAWAIETRQTARTLLAVAAVAPVLGAAAAFPEGGWFPFQPGALIWSLAAAAVVAALTAERVVRIGSLLYAIACVGAFVVPNPLGANATRLGMFLAAPLIVLTARRPRSPMVAVALVAAGWWLWSPALDGIARAGRDPSSEAAYHQPLVDAIRAEGGPVGRVEVVPTQRHWETVYVAGDLLLARGWERQFDRGVNALLYAPSLGADEYHDWLRDNGVRWVALADVALDPAAGPEARLVESGPPYLEPVWQGDHWRLWRVREPSPLVDGSARLVELGTSEITLEVTGPGPTLVRVRYSSHWSLDRPGCVEESPDGWTVVTLDDVGPVTMRPVLARSLPVVGSLDGCPS